jgi:hypothetical protein
MDPLGTILGLRQVNYYFPDFPCAWIFWLTLNSLFVGLGASGLVRLFVKPPHVPRFSVRTAIVIMTWVCVVATILAIRGVGDKLSSSALIAWTALLVYGMVKGHIMLRLRAYP